ncbi:NuA4 histone H4 acetyltransferase complex and the SWR1 complex subunit [Tieghemiomyces parasiticus]|uniref:Protein AF-9 homolog n=1 Tax=Tieghemiomyces parasiticus TaxID=78921 RepID=A0A9W8AB07_9FUNG|nr:NuA4 histone H4 acetyltransferase complex and the SWR1 complex subunit [Tieghemiomyces parasiticus]KAJ1926973.1 NuA4 histone H4 acetyltransferase complex and the SWR1 complex subunit [Tieghemiomyces parasiticus]
MATKSQRRVKGIAISRPVVYGNVATPLGDEKASQADHTHRWTVSLRGANNEDISYYVRKVVFKLHETYHQPSRAVDRPPYEVTETGWGEFEIAIKVYFHSFCAEKPITFFHHLRLHPTEALAAGTLANPTELPKPGLINQPVLAYHYDEIVFNEPVEALARVLLENRSSELPPRSTLANPYSVQAEQEELTRLERVNERVELTIESYRERIAAAETQLGQLRQEITMLEGTRK